MLFGKEHVKAYVDSDGDVGHEWQGTTTLILTTTGRRSGERRSTPLIYQRHDDDVLVVASNGGADAPLWYLNLQADPTVQVQIKGDRFSAHARVATAEEKPDMWRTMVAVWPSYDEYQAKAHREIPVVVLERTG